MNYIIYLFLICGIGCQSHAFSQPPIGANQSIPKTIEGKHSWNNDQWSAWASDIVQKNLTIFESAQDIERICPKFKTLSNEKKVHVIVELISAIAYFESAWIPTTRYVESTMGIDPITKKQVVSEGLLQLSYQDVKWARYCEFDWSKDKALKDTDPAKTIFDPKKNLDCGIQILANQVKNQKKIILSKGVYWAVIKENGKDQKIPQILKMVEKTNLCR